MIPFNPYDTLLLIGTVIEISPSSAKINLPKAASIERSKLYGYKFGFGDIGEFVIIENNDFALLGRIINVKLPEKDRLSVEPKLNIEINSHPIGSVQLLASINLKENCLTTGIEHYAKLGSYVYSAHPLILKWVIERSCTSIDNDVKLNFATVSDNSNTSISINPENIFGRHCAILGSTGGGKSWTISSILEQTTKYKSKVILFDATGEFSSFDESTVHVNIGNVPDGERETCVVFPYTNLTELDLFSIFTPSGQTQAPKLRLAMKSLKLAKLEPSLTEEGIIVKQKKSKISYNEKYKEHCSIIENTSADFDISNLAYQINEECVWVSDRNDNSKWGDYNDNEKSYCTTLLTRIEDILHSPEMECIFKIENKPSLIDKLNDFLSSDKKVLRISLKYLGFKHNIREIVSNAIGRYLLNEARKSKFLEKPLLIFLDEAHQFLNKSLGDEFNRYLLDAFDLIAKEGRKYSLNICLSTQRPRDIPEGILSQIGTLIVHRLTNEKDKELVEKACGEINKSVLSFLPNLVPGEAVLIGTDFPIPLTVKIIKPTYEPVSYGPKFQTFWANQE